MEVKHITMPRDLFFIIKDLVERYQLLLDKTQEDDDFFNEMRKTSIVECELALRDMEEIEENSY